MFGRGTPKLRNKKATQEWDFEDNDLSRFLVYDHNWRKSMKLESKSEPTVQDFWASTEPHLFRVNATRYADFRKFKKWLLAQVSGFKLSFFLCF